MPRRGLRLGTDRLLFRFDGREFEGVSGDTAASALLGSGVKLLGRSVKYRRPRGVFTAGPEEPTALLTVGTSPHLIPNMPAPQVVLQAGLELFSQNRWPSLSYDLSSILQLGGSLLGAGFYYKTFMWPSWRTYEGIIRRLAGLGAAPRRCSLGPSDMEHFACDVLVAGAGPAGLTAALAAARAGARVVICEREVLAGGELEFEGATIDAQPALEWVERTLRELRARAARVFTETVLVAVSDGFAIAHRQPGGLPGRNAVYKVQARTLVSATGFVERPIAFINNDIPGVMLAGAAERYYARYGVLVGQNAVLFGNHDRLYSTAARLQSSGVRIAAVVDTRNKTLSAERTALQRAGVECLLGHAVISAEGRLAVSGAVVGPTANPHDARLIACDILLVSGGWTVAPHAGVTSDRTEDQSLQRLHCGHSAFDGELGRVLDCAFAVGLRAARWAGAASAPGVPPVGQGDPEPHLEPFWRSPAARSAEKKQFVDLQNDVTVADLRQALSEGFCDIEHVKRYTTLGVGTEQGRTGGALGAAVIAELSGSPVERVGTSRSRPPYQPVSLHALCGLRREQSLRPERRTPLHDWHLENGGKMESMGLWMRPRYYSANGYDACTAGIAEAARVRAHGGVLDASTLGKIEIAGEAAAAFLDRMYLGKASTMRVGRAKYMVLLREDGMVLDDGVVLRLAQDRYLATASSGHGSHILSHMEFWRDVEWAGRAVTLTDVTEAWCVIVVSGPRSRERLQAVLGEEFAGFLKQISHMTFGSGRWHGKEIRVVRVSFSGELAFELHCRASTLEPLWLGLINAGLPPYGVEALDVLRVEKGYLASPELNGQTTPQDLCMEALVGLGNPCVGRDLLDRPGLQEADRPQLVGLRAVDGRAKFLAGAQITVPEAPILGRGHVTSSVYSPAVGEWVGLALVARRLTAPGTELLARDPLRGNDTPVRVVARIHVDPHGERMKA